MNLFLFVVCLVADQASIERLEKMQEANQLPAAVILAAVSERDLERVFASRGTRCKVHVPPDAISPITVIVAEERDALFAQSFVRARYAGVRRDVRVFVARTWPSELDNVR